MLCVFGDVLNCSWSTGFWAEEYRVNRRTGEVLEANTGYDVPNTNMHVTAPSGMLLFLRNMLITDDEHTGIIEIGKGLPTSWLSSGRSPKGEEPRAATCNGRNLELTPGAAELTLAEGETASEWEFELTVGQAQRSP